MHTSKFVFAVCAAGLLGAAFGQPASATIDAHKTMYLTFSRPVQLPGVSLGSGTYVFEIANPDSGADVVRVMSRDRSIAHFLGFTRATTRLHRGAGGPLVSLGEAAAGNAPPITVWWPKDESTGREFVYPRAN